MNMGNENYSVEQCLWGQLQHFSNISIGYIARESCMLLLRPVTMLDSLYQYCARHCPLSGIRIHTFFEVNTHEDISTAGFQVIM
jgi:hypothetical protein